MASEPVDEVSSRPLLTLGRVDLVRVQVGYLAVPEGPTYQHFLIDLPVPDSGSAEGRFDEARILAALEPVLYAGADAPRHYSLHTHRSHTSWGPSPGALEIGLLVSAGTKAAAVSNACQQGVVGAFRDLMDVLGRPDPKPTSRDAAVVRARRSASTAYALDPDTLSLSAEEHHPAANSWTLSLRTPGGDEYDVVVGLVDGYARSVRVRHGDPIEVSDSVGSE